MRIPQVTMKSVRALLDVIRVIDSTNFLTNDEYIRSKAANGPESLYIRARKAIASANLLTSGKPKAGLDNNHIVNLLRNQMCLPCSLVDRSMSFPEGSILCL
jgi:hypothetical protein